MATAVVDQAARAAHKELGIVLAQITRKHGTRTSAKAARGLLDAVEGGCIDGSNYLRLDYDDDTDERRLVGCALAHIGVALGHEAHGIEPDVPGWKCAYWRQQTFSPPLMGLSPLEFWVREARPGDRPADSAPLATLQSWLEHYLAKRAA